MNKLLISLIAFATFFVSCNAPKKDTNKIYEVTASVETTPVNSVFGEDAADDPAIYVNFEYPEKSWIIGTNKKAGLCVYNLEGEELYFTPVGLVNNVDLRYNFVLNNGDTIDILAASNRSNNSVLIMKINYQNQTLDSILVEDIISNVDEVYGCCMSYNKKENKHYAFVNGKDGNVEQYELIAENNDQIRGKLVKSYRVATQPEGMVVDDENQLLYVGEEEKGIWRFDMKTDAEPAFIANSDSTNINITYDIEGISIFYGNKRNAGYLIVSSQGNFTYAVFERMPPNNYIGSFKIVDSETIDGTQETDGLDVINFSFNDTFKEGLFVVQDGFNYDGDSLQTQNFKLVAWEKIADSFSPSLIK